MAVTTSVLWSTEQGLDDDQKAQARANIGAISESDLSDTIYKVYQIPDTDLDIGDGIALSGSDGTTTSANIYRAAQAGVLATSAGPISVGSSTAPIYFDNGVPVECEDMHYSLSRIDDDNMDTGDYVVLSGALGTSKVNIYRARQAAQLVENTLSPYNVGSTSAPVYFNNGIPKKVTAVGTAYGGTGNTSVDTMPTSGSNKMVTSDGVYIYCDRSIVDYITADGESKASINTTHIGSDKFSVNNATELKIYTAFLKKNSGRLITIFTDRNAVSVKFRISSGFTLKFQNEHSIITEFASSDSYKDTENLCTLPPNSKFQLYTIYSEGSTEIFVQMVTGANHITAPMTTLIENVAVKGDTGDSLSLPLHYTDIICNQGSSTYNINIDRLNLFVPYRFHFMSTNVDGCINLFNNSNTGVGEITVYVGKVLYSLRSGESFTISHEKTTASASLSYTGTVIRMADNILYCIWGY